MVSKRVCRIRKVDFDAKVSRIALRRASNFRGPEPTVGSLETGEKPMEAGKR